MEREAKYVVARDVLFPPLAVAGGVVTPHRSAWLETTYWDTPDHILAADGMSLRHRRGEGWTAKREISAGTVIVNRSERHFAGEETAPPEEALGFLGVAERADQLAPAVRLRVLRLRRDIHADGDEELLVEVIDDHVEVLDPAWRQAGSFREVELEVMCPAGEDALQTLVARVAAAGIRGEEPMPKYERALFLLEQLDG